MNSGSGYRITKRPSKGLQCLPVLLILPECTKQDADASSCTVGSAPQFFFAKTMGSEVSCLPNHDRGTAMSGA